MAKKPRMGRGLNALIGGATKPRPVEPVADPEESSDTAGANELANTAAPDSRDEALASASTPDSSITNPESVAFGTEAPRGSALESAASDSTSSANSDSSTSPSGDTAKTNADTLSGASPKSTPSASTSLSPATPVPTTLATSAESHPSDKLRMLGVDQITRGMYQPRRHFDQELLQELADSISAQGLIQPILVRAYGGKFELIAGERRWRAAQLAGISDIPAIVRDMDDQSVAAVSLIENIQRADLNPLEEAQALERLCAEFSMTHQQVAEAVGRSRVAVTNLMRLLELHDDVKGMVDEGKLDMGHARALLGAPVAEQAAIARRIVQQGLTVRAVEKLVKGIREGKTTGSTEPAKTDPNIDALGQKLGKLLGASVNIKHQQNGSGKLEINYTSVDELEGILSHIK